MNELIVKSLELGEISFLLRFPNKLLDPFSYKWISWIREYIKRFGVPPTLERFKAEFPIFVVVTSSDPLEDLHERTLRQRKNQFFIDTVNANQKALQDGLDPTGIVSQMNSVFETADGKTASTQEWDRTKYFMPVQTFKFGVDMLDNSAGGVANGDYVLIVGRPGSYKTTFAEWLLTGFMTYRGAKILYVSNENPQSEVMLRLDSFLAGFNPGKSRSGDWNETDKERIRAVSYLTNMINGNIIVPESACEGIADLLDMVQQYEPDIVFVDGIYLMSPDGKVNKGWEDTAAVSRALKRLARARKIPVMGTIQAGRGAEGTIVARDTIALTDAFLQDADTIISMNVVDGVCLGAVTKSRWGPTPLGQTFRVKVNFDQMTLTFDDEVAVLIEEDKW